MHSVWLGGAAAFAAVTLGAGPALAGTAEATLTCGEVEYQISGFGRGQVFHVLDGTLAFIVTRAEIVSAEGGGTVFDNPGKAGRGEVVTCTTTSPAPGSRSYVFSGFFTPLG